MAYSELKKKWENGVKRFHDRLRLRDRKFPERVSEFEPVGWVGCVVKELKKNHGLFN